MKSGLSRRRRRIRRDWILVFAVAIVALGVTYALGGFEPAPAPSDIGTSQITRALDRPVPDDHPRITFTEKARTLGVDMVHGAGKRRSLLPEDMGPGAALEDLDGDGDLDLFLVELCGPVAAGSSETVTPPGNGSTHRLYRNDGGTFTDITRDAGVGFSEYGIGVAAGDVDGDGLIDLYVTCYGPNRLLRNSGGLVFEDITAKAGVGDTGFSAGAAFADPDGDGDLDLYVCNYVSFRWNGEAQGASDWGGYTLPYTINPSSFPPEANRFYRNRGNGTFEEVAAALGIDDPTGRSLGVTFADLSGDGLPDLYVLNDISNNAYFENQGAGRFLNRSLESKLTDHRGAMGNAVADMEGDGDLDVFISHWTAQENGLYLNLMVDTHFKTRSDSCEFMDMADRLGLGQISTDYVGWGTAFLDYDLDGLLDLAVVNGSTMQEQHDSSLLIAETPLLFWQKPQKGFFEVGSVSGKPWSQAWNARGLVDGDIDADGDIDLVVVSNRGPVRILVHEGVDANWLRIRLRQPGANRHAVGAFVSVESVGRTCNQEVGAGTSYLCHRPLELTFGLGSAEKAERVSVRWPDGTKTTLEDVTPNRVLTVRKD